MKIIDLLNKIANGEEVPKKIKYAGIIWEYDNTTKDYISDDVFLIYKMNSFALNKSFEILEEEKKIPEKFKVHSLGDKDENGDFVSSPFPTDEEFMNKINDIIDYLKAKENKYENRKLCKN